MTTTMRPEIVNDNIEIINAAIAATEYRVSAKMRAKLMSLAKKDIFASVTFKVEKLECVRTGRGFCDYADIDFKYWGHAIVGHDGECIR